MKNEKETVVVEKEKPSPKMHMAFKVENMSRCLSALIDISLVG